MTVELGTVPPTLNEASTRTPIFDVAHDRVLLRAPSGLRMLVDAGQTITVQRPRHLSSQDDALWVLGSAWGAAAWQRGLLPINASAVRVGASLVAIGGRSGSGKSVLGTALARPERALVADDVLAVRPDGLAIAGHSSPRLWPHGLKVTAASAVRPVRHDADLGRVYAAKPGAPGSSLKRSPPRTPLSLASHGSNRPSLSWSVPPTTQPSTACCG